MECITWQRKYFFFGLIFHQNSRKKIRTIYTPCEEKKIYKKLREFIVFLIINYIWLNVILPAIYFISHIYILNKKKIESKDTIIKVW